MIIDLMISNPSLFPLVSILIPVYNRSDLISETIKSALNQTYPNIEVIIVDNASTDATWDVIQSFASKDSRVNAFKNDQNIGPVKNWRRCIDEATGLFGKILWSDDIIDPDFITKTISLLCDDTAFVCTGTKIFENSITESKDVYPIFGTGTISSDYYIRKALEGGAVPVSPGCALFRLSDMEENLLTYIDNKINSDFSMHAIGNDLMLFLLTAKEYKKVAFLSEPLSFFREHPGSISVASCDGKLPLFYTLVRASFAEKYRKDLVDLVAANAWLLLRRYPRHRLFGIRSLNDFFYCKVKINPFNILLAMARYFKLKVFVKVNKLHHSLKWYLK